MQQGYWSLCVRSSFGWTVEFGDHDKRTVEAELQDYRESNVRRSDLRIIQTDGTEAAIQAACARL